MDAISKIVFFWFYYYSKLVDSVCLCLPGDITSEPGLVKVSRMDDVKFWVFSLMPVLAFQSNFFALLLLTSLHLKLSDV